MFLLVGLGNPGLMYANTRHNVGFLSVDQLASLYQCKWHVASKFLAQISQIKIVGKEGWLCKPNTFMNLSGEAIAKIISFYKISLDKVIVIHDDINLPLGKIAYKMGGGSGGHNGLRSIDIRLGQGYHRIRVGVDRPQFKEQVADYVLSKLKTNEELVVSRSLIRITHNIEYVILGDWQKFNDLVNDTSSK